ncbi:MAG: ATP-binding protein, partial [Planctomycetota bacterium]
GIAPEEQARLFEKFYRGREAHELGLPGSGLGLALVKEVAEAHGGRVWVHSVQGEGAVFAIWLPAE